VDDGSTDDTASRVGEVRDPRLRLLRLPHQGVMFALNAGLAEAKGDYFARMDADDIALPDRLLRQVELMEKTNADVVGAQVAIFREDGLLREGFRNYEAWVNSLLDHQAITQNIFIEDPIPSPTLMMRRKTLLDLGGYDAGVYPDDYNLTLKNYTAGLHFGKWPEVLLRWRDHDARLSRTSPELKNQRFFDIKARYFLKSGLLRNKKIVVWGIGRNGKALFKALEAAGGDVAGFTADSRFIREKSLYHQPVRPFGEWENPFFLLATAARSARAETEALLLQAGLAVQKDYIPFC
jgi:glycosyltransferase involved in cell wall biosynthesis